MQEHRSSARDFARRMRREPTSAERALWRLLRAGRLDGFKFRRQLPIGPYVADFACLERRLIVEVDGPTHDAAYDARRDAWLRERGFRVLRVANEDVHDRPECVTATILAALERRI